MSRPPKTSGRTDSEHGQPAPGAAGVAEHDLPADLFADATAAVHTELLGAEPADEGDGADEGEVHRPLTDARLRSVLESVLFAADRPLSPQRIHELLEETASPPGRSERSGPPLYQPARITAALDALAADYQAAGRGIELHNVAGGYQFRTAPQNAPWVQRLLQAKPVRLSRAQLETLSIVAYRQPITRPEIDDIRGVDSGGSLKTLLERQMVRVLGKKEEPGRPLLYGTTREFLEFFNLRDLKDLPTLREYYDLSEEHKAKVRAEHGDAEPMLPLPETPQPQPPTPQSIANAPQPERVEITQQMLVDDAEQLGKIDELIAAVSTDFSRLESILSPPPPELLQNAPQTKDKSAPESDAEKPGDDSPESREK